MAAMLTYYPRRGLLEAIATGRSFNLPVHKDAARIAAWEHRFELRPGKYTLWDHCFEVPHQQIGRGSSVISRVSADSAARTTYDYPGAYAQRFDGVDKGGGAASHSHSGPTVYVSGRGGGIFLHGWPMCNLNTCIIVSQQWEDLRRAIAGETSLSLAIAI